MGLYSSTKTYGHEIGLSCAFRQWRAKSHCRFIHGYALAIRLEFVAANLDENNWVVDFGGLKTFKAELEHMFDHKLLVAADDPDMETFRALHDKGLAQVRVLPGTGCETFAEYIASMLEKWIIRNGYFGRVSIDRVEVREHGANSAIYYPNSGHVATDGGVVTVALLNKVLDNRDAINALATEEA